MKPKSKSDPIELRRAAEARLKERPAPPLPQTEADLRRLQHELQVHQIELEMQNDELRATKAEVEAGLEHYTELFDFAPVGYFNLSADGSISQVNLTGAKFLNTERTRLLGRRLGQFVAESDRRTFNDWLGQIFAGNVPQKCKVRLASEDRPQLIVQFDGRLSPNSKECQATVTDITALVQSQKLMGLFFDSPGAMRGIIELLDDDILHISDNPDAAAFFKSTPESMRNRRSSELGMPTGTIRLWMEQYRKSQHTGKPVHFEYCHTTDTMQNWFIVFVSFLGVAPSGHARFAYVLVDNTERKKSEETLRLSQEALQKSEIFNVAVLDSLSEQIAVLDTQGVIIAVNWAWRVFAEQNGAPKLISESVGLNYLTVCEQAIGHSSGDEAAAVTKGIRAVLSGERAEFNIEYPCHGPNEQRWFNMKVTALLGAREGAVIRHVNITERKQQEEAIRLSEARLKLAARAGGVGIWDWDVTKNQLVWDDEMHRLYGLPPGQFGGEYEAWKKGVHPEDAVRVEADIQNALRGDKEYDTEFRVVWPDGCVHHIRALAIVQRAATGEPLQMIGTNWDITAQKQNEEKLRESEARYRALFDSAAEAIMTMDQDGHILSMNRTAEVILGFSAEETLGTKMEKFLPFPHLEQHPGYLRHHLETGEKRIIGIGREVEAIHKDGHRVPLYLNVSEARIDQKRIFMGILRDLTAEKRAEQEKKTLEGQLIQSQKMEALGVLAGGIAHDFNNLLQSIMGYGDLALQWNSGDERTEKALTHIVEAGSRARDLVKQILDFSRRDTQEKKPIKLDLLLKEVRALINRTLPKNIKFHVSVPTGKRSVLGNASQIHQVLVNLCTNAIHAMPKGGRLDMEMDTHTFESGQELPFLLLPNITYKRIIVRDSGSGIDPAVLPRIFEPFFTTKGLGGTGLGLSVVHGIVTNHNGAISVKSELGVGTEFIVYLPTVERSSESGNGHAVLTPKHAGVVLLIDDEPVVLDVTQHMLEGMGFQVKAFSDPKLAVEAFTVNPAGYDLVLTDFAMPDMDGEAVCAQLRMLAPKLRIGVISAAVNGLLRDRLQRLGVEFILEKPFTSLELANRLAGI